MAIVCFGQQNWDYCWTAKQQLLTRLARRGHRVLYVNPDLDAKIDGRTQLAALKWREVAPGLEKVEPGLHVLTQGDTTPWLGRRVRARLRYWGIRAACTRLQLLAPVVLALRPDRLWLMRAASPAVMAYYAVDEWTAFGGLSEASKQHLRAREEELLREVDLALAVSPRLVERFRQIQPNTHHLENGADVEHFSADALNRAARHNVLAALDGARIGFVGQVDERLDQDLLLALSAAEPDWNFVLAGRVKPGTDLSRLEARRNIHLLGYQPYERLPGVLRDVDVCIVPYRQTQLTQSCNPLKVYEYLATGRPVVSVPLEGLLACRDAVELASTPDEFRSAIAAALADPQRGRERRLSVAAANAWSHRVDRLEELLEAARITALAPGQRANRSSRAWTKGRRVSRVAVRLDAKEESLRHVHGGYEWARLKGFSRMSYLGLRAGGVGYYALRLAIRMVGRLGGDQFPLGVRKILVARRGFLGDTVAFLPTLEALRRRYPHARIVLAVQPGFNSSALLDGHRLVDEIRPLHFCSESRAARLRGMLWLFAEGYDLLVTGIWYSLVPEAVYCGAPRHVGLYDGHPLQELATRVIPLDPNRHETDNHLGLVEVLGERIEPALRIPRLPADNPSPQTSPDRLRDALEVPYDRAIIVIHPGSKRESRRWPAERFAELVERLLENHPEAHVVFTGTGAEAELVNGILDRLSPGTRSRAVSSTGVMDLMELLALVRMARLVVCNDTGIMHVARACGVPLVGVLGPENDRRWGPYPIGTAPAVSVRAVVPCAPCARETCEALYCMRSTSVEEVLAAAEALLAGNTASEAAPAPGRGISLPILEAAGDKLYSAERRATHLSWQDLADAGFDLPMVSIVVLPTDAALRNGTAELRRRFYRSVAWQPYPRLELVVVERSSAGQPDEVELPAESDDAGPLPPVKRVRVSQQANLRSCITAGAAVATGQLMLLTHGSDELPARRLSNDVAAHVRGPAVAPINATGRPLHLDQLPDGDTEAMCELTWPRQLLLTWLDQHRDDPAAEVARPLAALAHSPAAEVPRSAAMMGLGRIHVFVRSKGWRWRRRIADRPARSEAPVTAAAEVSGHSGAEGRG